MQLCVFAHIQKGYDGGDTSVPLSHLLVQQDQCHNNLEGQAPELMEAVGVVGDTICVSTHEVGHLSRAKLGQRCQVHLKGLVVE